MNARLSARIDFAVRPKSSSSRAFVPHSAGGPDDYRDPRQIGSWVEKRFDEYGMELPEGAREMIDAAREGDFPDPKA